MPGVEFVEKLSPPVSNVAPQTRYDIGSIKVDGAMLTRVGGRNVQYLKQTLWAAIRRYRLTNPAANFKVAPYTDAMGAAYVGVFRLADTPPPSLHVAAE